MSRQTVLALLRKQMGSPFPVRNSVSGWGSAALPCGKPSILCGRKDIPLRPVPVRDTGSQGSRMR